MARRGLIIAIERYDKLQAGFHQVLPGTHDAARAFRTWLVDEHGVKPEDVFMCVEDAGVDGRTAGATRADVKAEVLRLKEAGKDRTEELFVFFSGHGLCFTDVVGARLADLMVCADFVSTDVSGDACIGIDEVQCWLSMCLGPGDHYWFLDSCRTNVTAQDIQTGTLGLKYDLSSLGRPTVYTLYSAVEGTVATVESGFAGALVDGLRGRGRSKVWTGPKMAVLFESVKSYVRARLPETQGIDQRKEGAGDGVIREIAPPPRFTCTVHVDGAADGDAFELRVVDSRGSEATVPFSGPVTSLSRVPDDYALSLEDAARRGVEAVDPLPVDLYEDATFRFRVVDEPAPAAPLAADAAAGHITIASPPGNSVRVRGRMAEEILHAPDDLLETALPAGAYTVDLVDDRGVSVASREVELPAAAEPVEVDLTEMQSSPLRDALLEQAPGAHGGGLVELSETLGPIADQGLDLWLSLRAARVQVDQFLVHVVAGFDDDSLGFEVAGARVESPLPGLWETVVSARQPLTFRVGDSAPLTLPTSATHIVLTLDDRGDVRINQFLLQTREPPDRVRDYVELQRRYAHFEALEPRGLPSEPVTRAIVGYDKVRRGHEPGPDIADVPARLPDLDVLAGRPASAPPIVREGFLATDPQAELLAELDYRGPWTMWRRASSSFR